MSRLANFIGCFPNWIDATYVNTAAGFNGVSFSEGGWEPDTLSYLVDEQMSTSAVSTGLTLGETRLRIDLGVARGIKIVAIPDSNLSRAAKVRVRLYDVFLNQVGDTGWQSVWNVVYPLGTLPIYHPSFVDGKLTEEDRASGYRMPWQHIFDDGVVARYVLLEIDDVGNTAGFVRLPRLFIAGGWQASINMKWGRNIGYEFNTTGVESLGGSKFFDIRTPRRVVICDFILPENEAFSFPFEMQRLLQNAKQLFVSIDPSNEALRHKNSFLARIREAKPLEALSVGYEQTGYVLEEVI